MSVLNSKLIVSLLDRVTGPAKGVSAAIDRMQAASRRNSERLTAMRGRMMDAVGAGWALYRGLSAPISAAIDFESKLEDIGQKINAPVKALPKLGQEIRKVARDTTQSASGMAEGMDILAGMGAGRDEALALLEPIGRAATAYKAEIGDLAQAGYAALDNLKVPALEFGRALDAMAVAGKEGAFELKDMAKYFPQLGAAYQGLGQKGVPAVADLSAALQIVRKGTGDSASAATNLSNILQKINAPLTRKNFAKMGVDLEREMAKATKRGLTPIEAIVEITNSTLKGNLGRLGDLFNDAQVQQGLRPLVQNIEEYRRIRAEALSAQGVVEEDYQRRLLTGEAAARRFAIAIENINNAVGAALLPALADIADMIVPIVNRMADWAEANPALTRTLVGATAALIGFRVATTAFGFAGLFMKGALLDMGIAALTAGRALGRATFSAAAGAVTTLLNPVKLVTVAFRALRIAVIGTGIGAVLVALAAAGTWIYNNWTGITLAFEAFRGAFSRAIEPIRSALAPAIDGFASLSGWVSGLLGPVDEMGSKWTSAGLAIGNFTGKALVSLVELPRKVMDAWSTMSWSEIGQSAARSLVDGFTGMRDRIGSIFSSIDLAGYWQIGVDQTRTALTGIVGTVDSVVANATSLFSGFGATISQAIGTIDFNGMMAGASGAIMGFYGTITDLLLSVDWGGLGVRFGELIRAGLSGAFDLWTTLMGGFTGTEATGIGATIAAAILSFDWAGVGGAILRYIGAALSAGTQFLRGVFRGVLGFDLIDEGARLAQSMWDGIRTKVDAIVEWFKGFPARIAALASQMVEAGAALMRGLFDGIKAVMAEIVAYIKSSITEAFASVRSGASGLLNKVTFGLAGTPSSSGGVDGARAKGGPVKAGGTYLVGEEGPELVTFPQDGRVHDAGKTARILRNAAIASSAMVLPAAAQMPDTIQIPDLPALQLAIPEFPALKVEMPAMPGVPAMPVPQPSAAVPFDVAALFEQVRPQTTDRKQDRAVEVTFGRGAININVTATGSQSPERIAEQVERRLTARLNALSRGAFSDGAN